MSGSVVCVHGYPTCSLCEAMTRHGLDCRFRTAFGACAATLPLAIQCAHGDACDCPAGTADTFTTGPAR